MDQEKALDSLRQAVEGIVVMMKDMPGAVRPDLDRIARHIDDCRDAMGVNVERRDAWHGPAAEAPDDEGVHPVPTVECRVVE